MPTIEDWRVTMDVAEQMLRLGTLAGGFLLVWGCLVLGCCFAYRWWRW